MKDLEQKLGEAIRLFWKTRHRQHRRQGKVTGRRDQGARSAVTGGAQLDGFIKLVSEILIESGIPDATLFRKKKVELPGFFRPTKEWDLLVIVNGQLLASIEFKSQIGPSFGNNYNNRTEEALGSSTDLWTAYREGAFRDSPRPWLGYFMLLEQTPRSTRPVSVVEPHFPVFPEFRNSSYAKRYELFCLKLGRERLYDAACFLLSDRLDGLKGGFLEPSSELSFARRRLCEAEAIMKTENRGERREEAIANLVLLLGHECMDPYEKWLARFSQMAGADSKFARMADANGEEQDVSSNLCKRPGYEQASLVN